MTGKVNAKDCLACCLHKIVTLNPFRMVIITYLMFWTEIHLQTDQHLFDGNIACKRVTIFFPIAAL